MSPGVPKSCHTIPGSEIIYVLEACELPKTAFLSFYVENRVTFLNEEKKKRCSLFNLPLPVVS